MVFPQRLFLNRREPMGEVLPAEGFSAIKATSGIVHTCE
jgi:hypothetical protein